MNYESYTHTDYSIKKKSSKYNYILTLSKFTNNTRKISSTLSPSSWNESIDDGLQKDTLINPKTGEIIIQWDKDNIIYINEDYDVHMTQKHKTINDEQMIKEHNKFIEHRLA